MVMKNKTLHPDSEIIDALGGTSAVARVCQVKAPSVCEWRERGIPKARRMYLELKFPKVLKQKPAGPSK